jgi:hypothetical protein
MFRRASEIQQRGKTRLIMRRLLCVLAMTASLPLIAACTKSIDRAERDVRRTQEQAAENVRREQRELEDTKREAAERIAQQERRVEDAARDANKEVIEERRELEDARKAEARRDDRAETTPRVADRPTRVDININRGRDGVDVDVNRNP